MLPTRLSSRRCSYNIFSSWHLFLGRTITTGIQNLVRWQLHVVLIRKYGFQSIQHELIASGHCELEGSVYRLGAVSLSSTTWKKLKNFDVKCYPISLTHQNARKAEIPMKGQFGNWHQHARYSVGKMPNSRHAKNNLKAQWRYDKKEDTRKLKRIKMPTVIPVSVSYLKMEFSTLKREAGILFWCCVTTVTWLVAMLQLVLLHIMYMWNCGSKKSPVVCRSTSYRRWLRPKIFKLSSVHEDIANKMKSSSSAKMDSLVLFSLKSWKSIYFYSLFLYLAKCSSYSSIWGTLSFKRLTLKLLFSLCDSEEFHIFSAEVNGNRIRFGNGGG